MNTPLDHNPKPQEPAIIWKPCLLAQGVAIILIILLNLLWNVLESNSIFKESILTSSLLLLGLGGLNLVIAIVLFFMKKRQHALAFLIMWALMMLIGFSTCLGTFIAY